MPILVVQMGHAGRTTGVTGAAGEQAFTQRVGEACHRLLSGRGWTIRTILADPASSEYKGDAMFAVHADGNNNPAVAGSSLGYQTSEGDGAAQRFRAAYVALGWVGPWHPDNYTDNLHYYYGVTAAVGQGNRQACIVECGTITNPAEKAAMESQEGVDRVAKAIGSAIGIYTVEDDMTCNFGGTQDTRLVQVLGAVDTINGKEDQSLVKLDALAAAVAALAVKVDELAARPPASASVPQPLEVRLLQS